MKKLYMLLGGLFLSCFCWAETPTEPFIYVLGISQDAGYPQAGCYQPHCMPGWKQLSLRQYPVSLAVIDPSAKTKYLFEATPALPVQLYELNKLAPDTSYTLNGVFLTHAHIGHYAGLMFFGKEAMATNGTPVFAMPRMLRYLNNNGPWSQLVKLGNIALKPIQNKLTISLENIQVVPFIVPHRDEFSETVGFRITGPQRRAVFIPDINKWEQWNEDLAEMIKHLDYALIDAAFYADGELPGRDMSKIPHPFVTETMAILDSLTAQDRQKVYFIHMNHTNPLLNPKSSQSIEVEKAGFRIARQSLKLPL